MKALSVVIAAYNVAPFIERCVRSLQMSSGRFHDDVEVIVVDDGSTDRTPELLKDLKRELLGLRIISQENCGLGFSRNRGAEASRGRYVWFLDGDDYVLPGAIDAILKSIGEVRPELLVGEFQCVDEEGRPIQWLTLTWAGTELSRMSPGTFYREHYRDSYAALFIIKRKVLDGLEFEPRINMQDSEFLPRLLSRVKELQFVGCPTYAYVKRKNSFINSDNEVTRDRYFDSVIEVVKLLESGLTASSSTCVDLKTGWASKILAVKRVGLLAYLYEGGSRDRRRRWLRKLRDNGLFPFDINLARDAGSKNLVIMCILANAAPILFPQMLDGVRYVKRAKGKWLTSREL